ncbi:MAG: hypothetical protein Q7K26_01250 [bacterium]|nr:hypothetical protein [bacterium]
MNRYIEHQLDIEICATEVMSDVVEKCPEKNREVLLSARHSIRSSAKRWLNGMPEPLRSGENTVASSAALSRVRISCLKAAVKMASSEQTIAAIVEMANSQFLRDYLPLMQKLHSAKSLFDTPIVLLTDAQDAFQGGKSPSGLVNETAVDVEDEIMLPHRLFSADQANFIVAGVMKSNDNPEAAKIIVDKFSRSMGPQRSSLTADDLRYLDSTYKLNGDSDTVGAGTALIAALDLVEHFSSSSPC